MELTGNMLLQMLLPAERHTIHRGLRDAKHFTLCNSAKRKIITQASTFDPTFCTPCWLKQLGILLSCHPNPHEIETPPRHCQSAGNRIPFRIQHDAITWGDHWLILDLIVGKDSDWEMRSVLHATWLHWVILIKYMSCMIQVHVTLENTSGTRPEN